MQPTPQNNRNPKMSPEGRGGNQRTVPQSQKPSTDKGHHWVKRALGVAAEQAPFCFLNSHHEDLSY